MVNKFFLNKDICNVTTKNMALKEIALFLSEKLKADSGFVFDSIIKRELVNSTGLEKGIAVPHAFIPDLREAHMAILSFDNPICDWTCVDYSLVDKALCLVLPETYTKKTPNVKRLTQIFQLLSNEQVLTNLQLGQTSQDILEILNKQISGKED